jgi:hypothetical protein
MSDNFGTYRSDSGNSSGSPRGELQGGRSDFAYPRRRVLVEEAFSITIQDLKRIHGRSKLLQAADRGLTIPISLDGKHLEVYMTFDVHRLPSRQVRWSDPSEKNVRLWMLCPRCWNRARKLFVAPLRLSDSEPKLQCRKCGQFVYMSQHCGHRKWWRMSAAPIRRLLHQRRKLMQRKSSARVITKLDEIGRMLWLFKQRSAPKGHKRTATGKKRGYKDVELVFGLF